MVKPELIRSFQNAVHGILESPLSIQEAEMALHNFYSRFFNSPKPETPKYTLPGLNEDDDIQDTDALIIQPPYAAERQRHMGYIAVVGADPGALLLNGLLQTEAHKKQTPTTETELRTITLPTDRRSAMGVLYELEYADLILFVLDTRQRLSSEHVRWLSRMQDLKVPLLLLVNHAERIQKRALPRLLETIEHRLHFPVVPIFTNDLESSRSQLVYTIFRMSPRLAAMLSLQSPALRPMLVKHLMGGAAFSSLSLDDDALDSEDLSSLAEAQIRLARQIKAVYGKGARLSRQDYQGMLSMATSITHYTSQLVKTLPTRDQKRRERLANAVSTLLVGYLTMVYHGETPPDIRKQVIPQIWRLYRASGQMGNS